MEEPVKGTVTSLSSVFPVEEAQKASQRVLDTISERQKELEQLQEFVADNTSLVNLVQKLPDELHHEIMVPFGKAAFFPGRLIHTNEFLVLLGDGYYADRTSKQTAEILKRRGKDLESQIESLKAVMQDLKAEASFFDATAAGAAEGLVEIREDYIEEATSEKGSIPGNTEAAVEDEEYARILSRIDELEKEELEAENLNGYDKDEQDEDDLDPQINQISLDHKVTSSEAHLLSNPPEQSKDELSTSEESLKDHSQKDISDQLNFEGLKVHHASKDGPSCGISPAFSKPNFTEKDLKENVQEAPSSKNEVSVRTPEARSDSSKAFTGSIVERTHKIESNPSEQTTVPPSKPVSRFKMQRR